MFDDLEIIMKNFESIPAVSIKNVAPNRTFDFGFLNEADGSGLEIRNGRLIEKNQRKNFFLKKRKVVKHSRF
jgi:hypothetical protein